MYLRTVDYQLREKCIAAIPLWPLSGGWRRVCSGQEKNRAEANTPEKELNHDHRLRSIRPEPDRDGRQRAAGWVGKIARAWSRHRTYRRALAEMRALSTDTLLDLDIYRGDLKRTVRDALRGK